MRLRGLMGVTMCLALGACGKIAPAPHPTLNATPQQRYTLTLDLGDTPGPIDAVGGHAVYEVTEPRCLAYTHWTRVNRVKAEATVPVVFTRVDARTYQAVVFADALQDANYYGMGQCHWTLLEAVAEVQRGKMVFDATITLTDMESSQPTATFFRGRDWLRATDLPMLEHAVHTPNRAQFLPRNNTDVFSMTLTPRWTPEGQTP